MGKLREHDEGYLGLFVQIHSVFDSQSSDDLFFSCWYGEGVFRAGRAESLARICSFSSTFS